jgi:non-ribosomal peptide synthetase component F
VRLATDGPRREAQSFEAGYISRSVPGTLLAALKALGKREDATLFMVLLAAFKTLLYRYTWQEDIVVGTPIANRNRTETEPLIGFFVNTLVLRSDLSANPTFRELIGRIRVATLGAYAHQDLPFDMLVDALSVGRDPGRNPLFQIFFALNNNPAPVLELDGLRLRQLPITNGFSKFDLEVSLVEKGPELMANIIYKTELFKARSIDRMLEHYSVILDEVARNPELRLMEVPLEDERAGCADDETAFDTDQFAFEL